MQTKIRWWCALGALAMAAGCGAPVKEEDGETRTAGASTTENTEATSGDENATTPPENTVEAGDPPSATETEEDRLRARIAMLQAASESDDLGELIPFIAPDERPLMSFSLAMMGQLAAMFSGMSAAFGGEEANAEPPEDPFAPILEKHNAPSMMLVMAGLQAAGDDEEKVKALVSRHFKRVDHEAFCREMGQAINESSEGDESEPFGPQFSGAIANLSIDGDTASATIGEEDVDFVKVDGEWYATVPMDGAMGPGGMPEMDMDMGGLEGFGPPDGDGN